ERPHRRRLPSLATLRTADDRARRTRMDVAQIATIVVAAMAPYLAKGGEEIAKKFGGDLYARIKARLTSAAGQESVEALEQSPLDDDAQATVRLQLKKAMSEDAAFRELLEKLAGQIEAERRESVVQASTTSGAGNATVQVSGKGNTTTVR